MGGWRVGGIAALFRFFPPTPSPAGPGAVGAVRPWKCRGWEAAGGGEPGGGGGGGAGSAPGALRAEVGLIPADS